MPSLPRGHLLITSWSRLVFRNRLGGPGLSERRAESYFLSSFILSSFILSSFLSFLSFFAFFSLVSAFLASFLSAVPASCANVAVVSERAIATENSSVSSFFIP